MAIPSAFVTKAAVGYASIDQPHDPATERVQDDGAVHLALSRRVLGDVRDPELIATIAPELTLHAIFGGGDSGHVPVARSTGDPFQACQAHESRHRLSSHGDPVAQRQLGVDASHSVRATRFTMRTSDVLR